MARLDQTDRVRFGERLRAARTTAGLTQEQAANALGVARTTMVAVERGERAVKAAELAALAALYGVSVNALLRETAVHVDLVGQFRRPVTATHDQAAATQALQLLHRLAAGCVELERRLQRPLPMNYPPEQPVQRGQLEQQAEDLALWFRNHLGVGLTPIQDLAALVELELGVRVFVHGLPSSVGGVYAYHPELGACVALNAKHPEERRAWTLAHELGHFLTQRLAPDVCDAQEGGTRTPAERVADLFAAALLMPGAAVRRQFSEAAGAAGRFSPRDLALMARRFRVSTEAMCRRLEQLELLVAGTFESLRRRGLTPTLVREELGEDTAERRLTPPRLTVLVAEAHERGLLTEGQAAEMLAVDRVTAREILDGLATDDLGDLEVRSA